MSDNPLDKLDGQKNNRRDKIIQEFIQSHKNLIQKVKTAKLLGDNKLLKRCNAELQASLTEFIASREHPFYISPPLDYFIGDVSVGYWAFDLEYEIKIAINEINGHFINAAATSWGKSLWCMRMLDNIQKGYPDYPVRYIVFASKKNCEEMNLIMNNRANTAYYLNPQNLLINPFYPIKGVNFELMIADLARVMATELGLMAGGQLYLQECIMEFLSKGYGYNLLEFTQWLSKKKESSWDLKGYRDRLSVRLTAILREIGCIFDCYQGIDDKIWVESNLILEIPASSSFITSFISGIILGRMFRFKGENQEFLHLRNLIVLEDIQSGLRNDQAGEMLRETSSYVRLVEESRYLNMSLMFNVQTPSLIPQRIRANCVGVFCKKLHDIKDATEIAGMMGLSEEQIEMLLSLKIEEGIFCNKAKGSVPLLIFVPEYPTRKVSQDEISNYQDINQITKDVVKVKPQPESEKVIEEQKNGKSETNKGPLGLSYQAYITLQDLQRLPFAFQEDRRNRLNLNTDEMSKGLDELLDQGFIEEYDKKINLGKSKGQFKLYLLTDKSIKNKKIGKQIMIGKGGYIHAFWIFHCGKYFFQKGYEVKKEVFLPDGKSIDLVMKKRSEDKIVERIAVEIELNNTDHILDNIQKCIKEDFDQIIMAVYDSKLFKKTNKLVLSNREAERWLQQQMLKIVLLSTFLPDKKT